MPKEDWVLSLDIQQAIQRVAVLSWSLSNKQAQLKELESTLASLEDAEAELGFDKCWIKVGDAFDETDDNAALDLLAHRQERLTAEISDLKKSIAAENDEVEGVKKMVVKELGDKVQLNMN